jgi:hypothetical protein
MAVSLRQALRGTGAGAVVVGAGLAMRTGGFTKIGSKAATAERWMSHATSRDLNIDAARAIKVNLAFGAVFGGGAAVAVGLMPRVPRGLTGAVYGAAVGAALVAIGRAITNGHGPLPVQRTLTQCAATGLVVAVAAGPR